MNNPQEYIICSEDFECILNFKRKIISRKLLEKQRLVKHRECSDFKAIENEKRRILKNNPEGKEPKGLG